MSEQPVSPTSAIFPTTAYEPAQRRSRQQFKPWHRPRKQLVRRQQWLQLTQSLLDVLPNSAGLNYLGLPGTDLLDLRAFHSDLCSARELRFLGFSTGARDEGEQLNLAVSLQEVKALTNVDQRSEVIRDDIRALARQDSMGQRAALKAGPFDVINLDLCNNMLTESIGPGSIYEAVVNLFGLQKRRKDPWLLFITTRVDRGRVDADVLARLDGLIASNVRTCEPFSVALRELVTAPESSPPTLTTCTDGDWPGMFCVALSKWVLKQALAHDISMEVKSTMSYRVNATAKHDDIVSLAYLLKPAVAPIADPTGLAALEPNLLDDCALAKRIPSRAARRIEIDVKLNADTKLREDMIVETAELLAQASYETDAYLEWAETH